MTEEKKGGRDDKASYYKVSSKRKTVYLKLDAIQFIWKINLFLEESN